MRFSILALFTCVTGVGATAKTPLRRCPAPFAGLLSDEVFGGYGVKMPSETSPAHMPDVRTGTAYLYRTVIREGAKRGSDFAGHYRAIRIGCGAATVCLAIADTQNGKVYFPAELERATALLVDTGTDVDTLNYRRNSRLLVVVGLPNEEPARAGMSYYTWRSGKLSLIRFTPAAKLCSLPPSTQF